MKRMIAAAVLALMLVPSVARADDAPRSQPRDTGKIGWAIALTSVGVYELWAVKTKNNTMSQSVQRSKAMKIGVGVGLGALVVHLYLPINR